MTQCMQSSQAFDCYGETCVYKGSHLTHTWLLLHVMLCVTRRTSGHDEFTNRWVQDVDVDRGCLVCNLPGCVEDEQHFIFNCPAYDHIRVKHVNLLQYCCTVADFLSLCESNACGGFLRDCFACRKEVLSV